MKICLTSGEPAGIGPDLCALLGAAEDYGAELVILGDRNLIAERAGLHGVAADRLRIEHLPLAVPVAAGVPDTRNAAHVLALLDRAVAGCLAGEFAAMVTAPLQKSIIAEAGLSGIGDFNGHTEYLAAKTGAASVVMMLVGGGMRVALATVHLPLSAVPSAITAERIGRTLRTLHRELTEKFGIDRPRILVAGLNPHAGEAGHLGREEIDVIAPVLAALRHEGLQLEGPLPADTLFLPTQLARGDAVLAMYHDQGLAVLKHAAFGESVNITLGLPIIRTSVDHGTALDRAGRRGTIETGSMRAAIHLAVKLAAQRALRFSGAQ